MGSMKKSSNTAISPRERLKNELMLRIKSDYPYLYLISYEDERTIEAVRAMGKELGREVFVWSSASGLFSATKPAPYLRQPQLLSQGLEDAERYAGAALFVILDAHNHLDSPEIIRILRNFADNFVQKNKTLLFIGTQEKIPNDLSRGIPSFYFPLPDAAELTSSLAKISKNSSEHHAALVQAGIGLTLREANRAFKRAHADNNGASKDGIHWVVTEKARLVKKSTALTFLSPETHLSDVGGLEILKQWLVQRGKAFSPKAKEFGLSMPKGILLLGVQGCGKSLCCKMVSAEWNVPLVRLDIGAIFNSYIGMSESNIRTALATAEAVAPCVLWIDEIEKGLSGLSSSDSSDAGTTSRVFSTILSWLQEKEAPVFVAATANRIEGLPPELLRRGRFDEIFFVDLPNTLERKEIFSIHLKNRGRKPETFDLATHAQNTTSYSGAEIEQIIINALFEAFSANHELSDSHLAKAVTDTVPLSKAMAENIQKLQRWAYDRARTASLRE